MPIPNTRRDLESFGYTQLDESFCRGCGAAIEWWRTPRDKKMPFTVHVDKGVETLISHWGECPKADEFRRTR